MVASHSSPVYPSAPRASPLAYPSLKTRKEPIHNPFDKFTQPEFDAWIDGITSALRRALGQEPELAAGPNSDAETSPHHHDRDHTESASDTGSERSLDVEDSFADVKARHAKGKARDPREGPGLGSQQHPIDLESEDEEEEEEEEEYEEEEDREILFHGDEPEEEEGWQGEEYEEEVQDDEMGSDIVEMSPRQIVSDAVHEEVIDLISDEEGDEEGDVSHDEAHDDQHAFAPDDSYSGNLFSGDEQEDEGQFAPFTCSSRSVPCCSSDFPPSVENNFSQPPDIRDPWEGPKTYAEDYYAGGDLRDTDLKSERPSPSNLTPLRQERVETFPTFIPGQLDLLSRSEHDGDLNNCRLCTISCRTG